MKRLQKICVLAGAAVVLLILLLFLSMNQEEQKPYPKPGIADAEPVILPDQTAGNIPAPETAAPMDPSQPPSLIPTPSPSAQTPSPSVQTPPPSAQTPPPSIQTPPPSVQASPEPSAPDTSWASETLRNMTLEEKIYQLFVVFPSDITGVSKVTAAGETTRKALETYPVGGLFYNKSNLISMAQTQTMLANVQSYTKIPLILTCDEEGGRVNRLMDTIGTTRIGAMLEYKDQGTEVARKNAKTIAGDLLSCGFNMDLAPVADVWSNPANTVIGDRAYSDDFEQAAELVAAAVEGFHDGGVACTLKHFPGHGDTSSDSHYGSVYIYKTLDELRREELVPFQAGIDAGADAVMMGHLIISDVDEEPALFSYRLVTELLRGEMGFQGVIITDALQMQAVTDHYGTGEIAVKAIKAGVDLLLCPQNFQTAADALLKAVENGEITEKRLDESVLRILTLKEQRFSNIPGR